MASLVPNVQQQEGSVDCGLFAITFHVEIAYNGLNMIESLQAINFEQSKMRDHLNKCLQDYGDYFQNLRRILNA